MYAGHTYNTYLLQPKHRVSIHPRPFLQHVELRVPVNLVQSVVADEPVRARVDVGRDGVRKEGGRIRCVEHEKPNFLRCGGTWGVLCVPLDECARVYKTFNPATGECTHHVDEQARQAPARLVPRAQQVGNGDTGANKAKPRKQRVQGLI